MKISTRVEYGMLALADIALYSENGSSVSAPDIAERQDISQKYLEQILTHLKQAGLICARKGLRGGYALSRPAGEIRLSDILNALDTGILDDSDFSSGAGSRGLRGAVNTCLWLRMNSFLAGYAGEHTLADLMQECRERMPDAWDYYMI